MYKPNAMRKALKKERETHSKKELMRHAEIMKNSSYSPLWYAGPYDLDKSDDEVRADFNIQFGRDPEEVISTGGGWLAGPLTDSEASRQEIAK